MQGFQLTRAPVQGTLPKRSAPLYKDDDVNHYFNGSGGDPPFSHHHRDYGHPPSHPAGDLTLDSRSVSHLSHATRPPCLLPHVADAAAAAPPQAAAPHAYLGGSYLDVQAQRMVDRVPVSTVPVDIGGLKARSAVRRPTAVEFDQELRHRDEQIAALSETVAGLRGDRAELEAGLADASSRLAAEARAAAATAEEAQWLKEELAARDAAWGTQAAEWERVLRASQDAHRAEVDAARAAAGEAAAAAAAEEARGLRREVAGGNEALRRAEGAVEGLRVVVGEQQQRLAEAQAQVGRMAAEEAVRADAVRRAEAEAAAAASGLPPLLEDWSAAGVGALQNQYHGQGATVMAAAAAAAAGGESHRSYSGGSGRWQDGHGGGASATPVEAHEPEGETVSHLRARVAELEARRNSLRNSMRRGDSSSRQRQHPAVPHHRQQPVLAAPIKALPTPGLSRGSSLSVDLHTHDRRRVLPRCYDAEFM